MSSGTSGAGLSDMGSALSSGSSGVGSNSFNFSMPTDFSGGSAPSTAGLSGLQSGMTLPTQSAGSNSYNFTNPTGGVNLNGLSQGLGAASQSLAAPASSQARQGAASGRLMVRPQSFSSPISDALSAGGSQAGNSLIQLLQKYRVGASA